MVVLCTGVTPVADVKPPIEGNVWWISLLPILRHSNQIVNVTIEDVYSSFSSAERLKVAPCGKLGPTLLWTCNGGKVSGVATLKERVLVWSRIGRVRVMSVEEFGLLSWMIIPAALLTTLLPWMDVVILLRLSHSLCTMMLSSPVTMLGVRRVDTSSIALAWNITN